MDLVSEKIKWYSFVYPSPFSKIFCCCGKFAVGVLRDSLPPVLTEGE